MSASEGDSDDVSTGISLLASVDEQSLRSARADIEDALGDPVGVDVSVDTPDSGTSGGVATQPLPDGGLSGVAGESPDEGLSPNRERRFARREHRWARQRTEDQEDLLNVAREIESEMSPGSGGGGGGDSNLISGIGGLGLGSLLGGGGGLLGGVLSGGIGGLLARATGGLGPVGAIVGGTTLNLGLADKVDDLDIPLSDQAADILRMPMQGVIPMLETNFSLFKDAVDKVAGVELGLPDIPTLDVPDIPALDVPDLPALDVPEMPTLGVPDLPALDIPDLPTLDVPDLPTLSVPDLPTLDVPDLPSISLPSGISDILDIAPPPLPDLIPVAPTQSLISTIQSFTSGIGSGGPLDTLLDLGGTALSATPGGLAINSTRAFLDDVTDGGGGGGGVPSLPEEGTGLTRRRPERGRETGSGSGPTPTSPQAGIGNPVTVDINADATASLGDINVTVNAAFDDLRGELDDIFSEIDNLKRELDREITAVERELENETRNLRREIDRGLRD